jgi:hypothetical protein
MTRTRRWTTVSALTLALAITLIEAPRAAVAEQPSTLPDLMRLKLNYAQDVLRALVLEDYTGLDRAAQQLGGLTKAAAWGVLKTPEYARYSNEFLRSTEGLVSAARARKLEAAAGEYGNLTQGCVNCHRYIRGARLASLDEWRSAPVVSESARPLPAHE